MSDSSPRFTRAGSGISVRKGRLAVEFDACRGSLRGVRYAGALIAEATSPAGFLIDGDNQKTADSLGLTPSLIGCSWEQRRQRLSLCCRLADIQTEEVFDFRTPFPGFSRTLRFQNRGRDRGKFRDTYSPADARNLISAGLSARS